MLCFYLTKRRQVYQLLTGNGTYRYGPRVIWERENDGAGGTIIIWALGLISLIV